MPFILRRTHSEGREISQHGCMGKCVLYICNAFRFCVVKNDKLHHCPQLSARRVGSRHGVLQEHRQFAGICCSVVAVVVVVAFPGLTWSTSTPKLSKVHKNLTSLSRRQHHTRCHDSRHRQYALITSHHGKRQDGIEREIKNNGVGAIQKTKPVVARCVHPCIWCHFPIRHKGVPRESVRPC